MVSSSSPAKEKRAQRCNGTGSLSRVRVLLTLVGVVEAEFQSTVSLFCTSAERWIKGNSNNSKWLTIDGMQELMSHL